MQDALLIKPAPKAVLTNLNLVFIYGGQMLVPLLFFDVVNQTINSGYAFFHAWFTYFNITMLTNQFVSLRFYYSKIIFIHIVRLLYKIVFPLQSIFSSASFTFGFLSLKS
jgi:hypothetical protein